MLERINTFQKLIADNLSGSSSILRMTIDWILISLKEGVDGQSILDDLQSLCAHHPAMALLQNLHRSFTPQSLKESSIHEWLNTYRQHETDACRHFAGHLSNMKSVLVHSNSSLLLASLQSVAPSLSIFCTESRPAFEGRLLAETLSRTHHRVCLVSDMAAFSMIARVDALAFGCDSITSRGIVNKIGTAPLAQAARIEGKRNYFVATSEKWLPVWNDSLLTRQGSPQEIYDGSLSLPSTNYYFDLTGPGDIHGVFWENGLETGLYPC